jgi:hypothetical protein
MLKRACYRRVARADRYGGAEVFRLHREPDLAEAFGADIGGPSLERVVQIEGPATTSR